MTTEHDYLRNEITDPESPDTEITVWEIKPNLDNSYDYVIIRSYQNAVKYAKAVVEDIMSNTEKQYPAIITIRKTKMTIKNYNAILEIED